MAQSNTNQGRDQNIINNPGNVTFQYGPSERRSPTLNTLLKSVRSEVTERLEQSIHRLLSAKLINIDKVCQPSLVDSPWRMTLSLPEQPPKPIPSQSKILDVFEQEDVEQRLLLLGLPGSGKTTTMLELADGLLQRCEKSLNAPIPVLLNLASWQKSESIFGWMVREIKSKYALQEFGEEYLKQQYLLPLLDGLDEVDSTLQADCAKAINHWLTQDLKLQPVGTLICCRIKDYQTTVKHLLSLKNAIKLEPLEDRQIKEYLFQFSSQEVWRPLQQSPELLDLLRSPLFLSVFGYIARRNPVQSALWQQMNTEQMQTYLFKKYFEVAMDRLLVTKKEYDKGIQSKTYRYKSPPDKKLYSYMCSLAKILERQGDSELVLERVNLLSAGR